MFIRRSWRLAWAAALLALMAWNEKSIRCQEVGEDPTGGCSMVDDQNQLVTVYYHPGVEASSYPITPVSIKDASDTYTIVARRGSYFVTHLLGLRRLGVLESRWGYPSETKITIRIDLGGESIYIDDSGSVGGSDAVCVYCNCGFRISTETYREMVNHIGKFLGVEDYRFKKKGRHRVSP